jgi:hypothetical protein
MVNKNSRRSPTRLELLETVNLVSLKLKTPLLAFPKAPVIGTVSVMLDKSLIRNVKILIESELKL